MKNRSSNNKREDVASEPVGERFPEHNVEICVPLKDLPHAHPDVLMTAQIGGKLYRGLKVSIRDGFVYLTGRS